MLKKILLIIFFIALFGGALIIFLSSRENKNMILGVSFSPEYAGYLNYDPRKAYRAILDDWRFKYIRLPAQWDKLEKQKGIFDFRELDYLMDEAGQAGAKVTLVVGQKIPRWPECHIPDWSRAEGEKYQEYLLNYISTVVKRYKSHPALEIWQVENEPFLAFGAECPETSPLLLKEELALVKSLDSTHPTLVTDSGELSTWRKTANAADLFGTTMYRVVWSETLGYWNYDWLPAFFYRLKLWLNHRPVSGAYIMELQAEPWIPNSHINDTPLAEQYKSMDLKRLEKNIDYAGKTGMPRAYLWGAEWWYWLKEKGDITIYDYIKNLKK